MDRSGDDANDRAAPAMADFTGADAEAERRPRHKGADGILLTDTSD